MENVAIQKMELEEVEHLIEGWFEYTPKHKEKRFNWEEDQEQYEIRKKKILPQLIERKLELVEEEYA